MREKIAGAILWLGTRTGIVRKQSVEEKPAFEDGMVREANADVVIGAITHTGSSLSPKEIALREKLGGADVHDAAMLARRERGDEPLTNADIPLGDVARKE
jgi:hypothetical protein